LIILIHIDNFRYLLFLIYICYNVYMKYKNKHLMKSAYSILLISALFVFLFVFNSNHKEVSAPEAELRFAEYSDNKSIKGSMLPASCESAPKTGSAHFAGDSSGSCACAVTGQTCNGDYIFNHKTGCGTGFNVAYCTYGCTNNGGTPYNFGPRCNNAPTGPNCPAQTVTWAPGCSAYVGPSYTGNVINVTNSAAGYTGNNSVSCNGTSLQVDGATFSGIQPSCSPSLTISAQSNTNSYLPCTDCIMG
jgi:hypothetical protein